MSIGLLKYLAFVLGFRGYLMIFILLFYKYLSHLCKNSLKAFREHSGSTPGTFQRHSGNISGAFREHSGSTTVIPKALREHYRTIPGTFREHFGSTPGTFQRHSGNISGALQVIPGALQKSRRLFVLQPAAFPLYPYYSILQFCLTTSFRPI